MSRSGESKTLKYFTILKSSTQKCLIVAIKLLEKVFPL
jgi:hypothetical protein